MSEPFELYFNHFEMSFSRFRNDLRQSSETDVRGIYQQLHESIIKRYNTSQSYLHLKLINDAIAGRGHKQSIIAQDLQFDDGKEHMEKYYQASRNAEQLPELLDYYQYYTQEPIDFLKTELSYLAVHHSNKKAILYSQLKKQLNISNSSQNSSAASKDKPQLETMSNVLSGLTRHDDQSYCLAQTLQRMVKHYGNSAGSLAQIDSQYKSIKNNIPEIKIKKRPKQPHIFTKSLVKNLLESTSTSIRNSTQKGIKNPHKRIGSCQLINVQNVQKYGKSRRKSTDLNIKRGPGQRLAALKTASSGLTQISNEKQLKETIERFRCRISRSKENLQKKSTKTVSRKGKSKR